ncbi:hypothetical protein RvY_04890-2 [Ramazzottius varieornatus]|nr:hypothetical protein RvY_04890-2 [Ramazzottius varieornatus]
MGDDSTIVVADTRSHPQEEGRDRDVGGGVSTTSPVAETTVAATTPATMTTGPSLRNRRMPGGRRGGQSSLARDEGNKFLNKNSAGRYHQHAKADRTRRHLPSDGSESNDQVAQVSVSPAKCAGHDHASSGRQKRMLRRRERNKWKPYHQLTWQEKKELEEKERIRSELRRNQPTALGYPAAPFNSSQFLMADHKSDHQVEEMEGGGSSEDSSLADMEGVDNVALDRGYAQEWARVLSVNLENFSKQRLISHVLEVEQEKADLERRLRMLEKEVGGRGTSSNGEPSDRGTMTAFQDGDIQLVDGVK